MNKDDKERIYIAIDLKSFYASVECHERGFDPLTTNLVVADSSRTEKTICLAVSPSLKQYGIPGRARLFEVVQKVKEVNASRKIKLSKGEFEGESFDSNELNNNPRLELNYIVAVPRMALYMEYSARIYNIYLKYIAPEDIHIYSVDEVFIDATDYLNFYHLSPKELAITMINDVFNETGITATAGIGTNLYLAKVAMDIVAKHIEADENGVRIAELDELSYRKKLWNHEPITDFWRVGQGYAKQLQKLGIYTMGDVARCSIGKDTEYYNEELLYGLFGVNAELLIDHAWGYEPCTIAHIKAYKPESNSMGSGQVLKEPYDFEKTEIIVREMTELLVLDLVDKGMVTNQIVLTIGYDKDNLTDKKHKRSYEGEVTQDRYGRSVPKHAHGTVNFEKHTSSTKTIVDDTIKLYRRIVDPTLLSRRVYITANNVILEKEAIEKSDYRQMSLLGDFEDLNVNEHIEDDYAESKENSDEKKLQEAMLQIQKKYGKNAILKGYNLKDGATTIERNGQIGGHKA